MSLYVIFEESTGKIIQSCSGPEDSVIEIVQEGCNLLSVGDASRDFDRCFVSDGGLVDFPPAPSPHHTWDWHSHTWIGSLDSARSALRSAVDAERDRRLNFSINYDGKRLDADARARENLKSKLEELKSRDALGLPMSPALMVWRDADNTTHQWATQAEYRAWLEGFAIAMSERGTLIYGAAWAHKANIEALPDIDSIIAYSLASGWPS